MIVDEHETGIDALLSQLLAGGDAEHVVAGLANENHVGPEPSRRNGLVGPFAAGIHQKSSAEYGFPRPRQVFGSDHHIGIGTADHQNFSFS